MKLAIVAFACLIVAAQAAIPKAFQKSGGPRETLGAWTGPMPGGAIETGSQGKYLGDDNMSIYSTMDGKTHETSIVCNAPLSVHPTGSDYWFSDPPPGKTLSHECLGRGRYKAIIDYTTTDQDGKVTKSRVCETGHVDLESGIYRWEDSETECPSLKSLKYVVVRSSPWKAAKTYSCK